MRLFWVLLIIITSGCSSIPNRFDVKTEAVPEIVEKNITIRVTGEKPEVVNKFQSALIKKLSVFGIKSRNVDDSKKAIIDIELQQKEVNQTKLATDRIFIYYPVDRLTLYVSMRSPTTGEVFLNYEFAKDAWHHSGLGLKENLDSLIHSTAANTAALYANLVKSNNATFLGKWFSPYINGYLLITAESSDGYNAYIYEKNRIDPNIENETLEYKFEEESASNNRTKNLEKYGKGFNYDGAMKYPASFRIFGCALIISPIGNNVPFGRSIWFAESCYQSKS